MPTPVKSSKIVRVTRANSRSAVKDRLRRINWDFPNAGNGDSIHSVHPYPARFIADIPRTLIRELPFPRGTAVLDPFCGCGTTLVEAQAAGFSSVGIDLNPIACLIARVKTQALPVGLSAASAAVVHAAKAIRAPIIPPIPNLDHWFQKPVQAAIASLTSEIESLPPGDLPDHMRLALSSILVRVSNQDSDTRYAAVGKRVSADQVFAQFLAACRRLEDAKAHLPFSFPQSHVIQRDILDVTPDRVPLPIGLVITSPPYPNAYEYWLYHKYRMWWLGYDPVAVKAKEIGARAHYFKKNHPTVDDFRNQMRSVFSLLSRVTVPSGFLCIVIGRSRIHGQDIDNGTLLTEIAVDVGFLNIVRITRNILSTRKSFNLSHARIVTEDLLVFQRPPDRK